MIILNILSIPNKDLINFISYHLINEIMYFGISLAWGNFSCFFEFGTIRYLPTRKTLFYTVNRISCANMCPFWISIRGITCLALWVNNFSSFLAISSAMNPLTSTKHSFNIIQIFPSLQGEALSSVVISYAC